MKIIFEKGKSKITLDLTPALMLSLLALFTSIPLA
jgi:hypothetical protein